MGTHDVGHKESLFRAGQLLDNSDASGGASRATIEQGSV